ncbi:MAG TPA: hypothetical protein VF799_02975 [Geobacteraceae bacterium]
MRKWLLPVLLLCLNARLLCAQESGDENSDLNLIPESVETAKAKPSTEGTAAASGKAYLENALTGWVNRGVAVQLPIRSPNWQNRTSLDLDCGWQIAEKLRLNLSNRLNLLEGDTITFPSGENLRNDFREGYLSWELLPRTFLEAGRINLKNGVALGYNPTDFFRSRATVSIASIDPSALRENRLGSLMVRAQKIFDNGAATLAFSPRVTDPSPLLTEQKASFNPLFSQTNGENRFLATFSYNIADLNPQALLLIDRNGPRFGLNISRVITSSVVAYGEWSGGREATLTERAVAFGRDTGTLPARVALLPQTETGRSFRNDLAVGASWTSSFNLTVNLEYHYHQGGFAGADFANWVALGRSNTGLSGELWFIRQYAGDRQEPLMQHQFFLRADWQDVIPSKLNLGGVLFITPYDGSLLAQASAQYFVSRNWTVGLYLGGTGGGSATVYGSLPWSTSGVLQIVRYF